MARSLQKEARFLCPPLSLRVCSNSCPLSGWCCLTIHPLLPPSSFVHQGLFQWVGSWHQVPKYWSFSFRISPSNEYSELISFRIDWFDPFAVPGTLKSLLQHHNLKASIFWHSAFFLVQLSHPYVTLEIPAEWTVENFWMVVTRGRLWAHFLCRDVGPLTWIAATAS